MKPKGMPLRGAALAAGMSVANIRYYERIGLIERPPQPSGPGSRRYPQATVRRLRAIRHAQSLGFELSGIRDLLLLDERRDGEHGEVRANALAKLTKVQGKIRRLRKLERALMRLIDGCEDNHLPSDRPILAALDEDHSVPPESAQEERDRITLNLDIQGMHCEDCAQVIENALLRLQGVHKATVSYRDGSALVVTDPQQATAEDIKIFLEFAGYPVVE